MKPLNPKFIYGLLLLAFLLGNSQLYAHKKEFTKVIKEKFATTSNGQVHLENKKGKIDVKTWDKNTVQIEVIITVMSGDATKAQRIFDRIAIDFETTTSLIQARTLIEEPQASWWSVNNEKGNFRIDYEVFMPKSNELNIQAKYGDIYVAELNAPITIHSNYGTILMDGTNSQLDLTLGHISGTIKKVKQVEGTIKYSKIRIDEADFISLESKNSQVKLKQVRELTCETKYDDYKIGTISELRNEGKYDHFEIGEVVKIISNTKYTDFQVKRLIQEADMVLEYGGATFINLDEDFSTLNFQGKHVDYKVNVNENTNYQIDITNENGAISYPSEMKIIHEEKKNAKHEVQGYIGKKNTKAHIKVRLLNGTIKIDAP